jgi:hypothetical protein
MATFLSKDVYIDPKFKEEPKLAEALLQIRHDSRGDVIKRAFLGDKDTYKAIYDKKNEEKLKKTGIKV